MKKTLGFILIVTLLLSCVSALATNITISMPKNFVDEAGNAMASYDVHVIDQDGHAVPGVTVSLFIENEADPEAEVEATANVVSDEKGIALFEVSPMRYLVKATAFPEGYSVNEEATEIHTVDTSSSVILTIHKD